MTKQARIFTRFVSSAAACVAAVGFVPVARARHVSQVIDNHLHTGTGHVGAGATNQIIRFPTKNPPFKIEPPGKCGEPFVGGTLFGHPDPRSMDPKAACGHGVVSAEFHEPFTQTPPLLILPVTTPVAPGSAKDEAARLTDASHLLRNTLPQLDRPNRDQVADVTRMRSAVHAADVLNASKHLPRPARQQQ